MITYFYKKEDEKYQEFQIFASNKSNNGVLFIYQRLVSYNEFSEWKIESSDDPTYEFLNNNLAVLTVKNDLKKYFTVLTEDTFYKTLESKRITFVFFYLPCK